MAKSQPPVSEESALLAEKLYSMQLGDRTTYQGCMVTRVPGGWVLQEMVNRAHPSDCRTHDPAAMATCFVPYSKEFEPD